MTGLDLGLEQADIVVFLWFGWCELREVEFWRRAVEFLNFVDMDSRRETGHSWLLF